MKLRVFSHTDVGQVRTHNEDFMLVDERLGLYIVADGVGGAAAGEVASRLACEVIQLEIARNQTLIRACAADPSPANRQAVTRLLGRAIQQASQKVFEASQIKHDMLGMASTIALVLIVGRYAMVAHVGDSRAYLSREGKVHQLTFDHSLVAEQLRRGDITPEQAQVSSMRNVLTRAVGFQPVVDVDTLQVELAQSDRILLCSDGLYNYLPLEELTLACQKLTSERMAPALISTANKRGGADNITLIILEVEQLVTEDQPRPIVNPQDKLAALKAIPLFNQLTYTELHGLLSISHVVSYDTDDLIIEEDQPGDHLFVSITGSVRVIKQGQAIATLPPGSSFGEMALIDRAPRSADVVALEPVKALTISRDAFFSLLKREPELSVKLLWAFCQAFNARLRETSSELSWLKSTHPDDDSQDMFLT